MSIFPMFQMNAPPGGEAALPLYRDAALDFSTGLTRWSGGNPVTVSGLAAVKCWAWRAVNTARFQYPAFSWDYGCELRELAGQPYRAETKSSEAGRYVEEALLASPYILEAGTSEVRFSASTLHLRVWFRCVYGEEEFDV